MKDLENIMVAIDSNDSVGDLLGYAEGLAQKFNAKVWVIHVLEEKGSKLNPTERAEPDDLMEDQRSMKALCEAFLDEELESEIVVLKGPTVEKVLEQAKELDTDLLIVGTHKHSFLHNLISESVSIQLFKKVSIPLLAIPFEE